jgi:hypothetical protein
VRDRSSVDWAIAGPTHSQPIQALLVAGSYDGYYSHVIGDQVPGNKLALIHENIVIEAPPPPTPHGGGLQLEVDSLAINGQMFLNDVAPPASQFDDGILTMINGFDSIEVFYNRQRRHSYLDYMTPDEYERYTVATNP